MGPHHNDLVVGRDLIDVDGGQQRAERRPRSQLVESRRNRFVRRAVRLLQHADNVSTGCDKKTGSARANPEDLSETYSRVAPANAVMAST